MSGTSLDGLDLCLVDFALNQGSWAYELIDAQCVDYPDDLQSKLRDAHEYSASSLAALDIALGRYIAESSIEFLQGRRWSVDLIASHGHTIFHQPDRGYTTQIGSGHEIHAHTGITTVWDFRSLDVSLGGQGAPLVPIGDLLLFGDYTACINLGGIANISWQQDDRRLAYDICPINMCLNQLAQIEGMPFDRDGILAKAGQIIPSLLQELEQLDYYQSGPPKSLGREWYERYYSPLLSKYLDHHRISDLLTTNVEHMARQLSRSITHCAPGHILMTGGGSKNLQLIDRLSSHVGAHHQISVPEEWLIDYKEALVFALLGVLRVCGEMNVLSSVTGARRDSCSGQVIWSQPQ